MCKLLGISYGTMKRNSMKYYLGGFFSKYGDSQPHGWGVSLYQSNNKYPALFKEAIRASASTSLKYLLSLRHPTASYVIAHVRFRSVGPIIHHLSQPFVEDNFTFVHNGTLMTFANSSFDSKDTSDSLYMFNRIKGKGAKPEALAKALRDMNQHGSMSILASDGTYLLAYRDMNRSNSLYYKKFPGGYVVCSEPIFAKRASWTLIQPGEFVIFNKGQIV